MDEITKLRRQIDAIDDEMIALIKKRSQVVAKVGNIKTKNGASNIIRPGREAIMLRRIISHAKDTKFSPQALASLWRIIISASGLIEQDIKVILHQTPRDSSAEIMVRDYYGSFIKIEKHRDLNEVFSKVSKDKSSIGILNTRTKSWWLPFLKYPRLKCFAAIPFITKESYIIPPLLAFGHVTPEPSGDDSSLFQMRGSKKLIIKQLSEFKEDLADSPLYIGSYANPVIIP